jgi:hypothetical protein
VTWPAPVSTETSFMILKVIGPLDLRPQRVARPTPHTQA